MIDSGFLTHATGWFNGDFNYDGVVNGSDYTLIDNAFNTQGAQITAVVASEISPARKQTASYFNTASSITTSSLDQTIEQRKKRSAYLLFDEAQEN